MEESLGSGKASVGMWQGWGGHLFPVLSLAPGSSGLSCFKARDSLEFVFVFVMFRTEPST